MMCPERPTEDTERGPVADGALDRWTDARLVETYRRLRGDLRRRGFDGATGHRTGRVEIELRRFGLDPGAIARDVEGRPEEPS